MRRRVALGALFALGAGACNQTPAEMKVDAQEALSAGHYKVARDACDPALDSAAVRSDKALAQQLERIRLDAIASAGDTNKELLPMVDRLAVDSSDLVDANLFAKLAGELSHAENFDAAIDAVKAGETRFPKLQQAFDGILGELKKEAEAKAAAGNDALLQHLNTIPYLGGHR